MNSFDVIIVGAGPAGSTAATELSQAGFSCIMLERKERLGYPNHCGEGLSDLGLAIAGFSGDEPFIERRVPGARIIFPNRTTVHFPQKGYCIDRPEFDRALVERAVHLGAAVEHPFQVEHIERRDSSWLVSDRQGRCVRGRFLIGAGGARCPVAHKLGQRPYLLPAFQYKFDVQNEAFEAKNNWLDFYYQQDFPGGYAWAFPRRNQMAIGAGSRSGLKIALNQLCRKLEFDPRSARCTEGGPIPFLRNPLKLTFDHGLLTGDAGGFIYPLTKGGIHGAIWSGKLAGQLISQCLVSGNQEELDTYHHLVRLHPSRRRRHLVMPHTLFGFNDRMYNSIGSIMDGKDFHDMAWGKMFKTLLTQPSWDLVKAIGYGGIIQHQFKKTQQFAW